MIDEELLNQITSQERMIDEELPNQITSQEGMIDEELLNQKISDEGTIAKGGGRDGRRASGDENKKRGEQTYKVFVQESGAPTNTTGRYVIRLSSSGICV